MSWPALNHQNRSHNQAFKNSAALSFGGTLAAWHQAERGKDP
jgi:hypothetical protein